MLSPSSGFLFIVIIILGLSQHSWGCQRCPSRKPDFDTTVESQGDKHEHKTWLFAVNGRKRPYSFLDDYGDLIGFDVDLIEKVCERAKKRCKMVLSEFTECSVTSRDINYAGRGLMAGWFDACPGYVNSIDREAAFDFTDPYLDTYASFTVAPGNPSSFDPDSDDFSKFTLTHLTGAVTNSKCLARLGKKTPKIIVAADLPEAKALLLNRTADVLFSPRSKISDLEVLPQRERCDAGGTAVMVKKGSQLARWWNPAFRSLVMSGEYKKLCDDSRVKYNTNIRCMASPTHSAEGSSEHHDKKVWLFSASGRRKPFNYLDDTGRLVGFDVDFVQEVCNMAGKKCASVLQEFTECTYTHRNTNFPGRGLMDGWVDACTGYGNTLDRESAFDFTYAYLRSTSYYSVAPGNPSGFQPTETDFSKYTFTHLTGAYTNAKCLSRQGKKFGKIIIAANLPEAKALIFNRTADVLFSPRSRIPGLTSLTEKVDCARTGVSVMVKRGSPLPEWWNPDFRTYVKSGQFARFCEDSRVKYDYPIDCLSDDVILSFP